MGMNLKEVFYNLQIINERYFLLVCHRRCGPVINNSATNTSRSLVTTSPIWCPDVWCCTLFYHQIERSFFLLGSKHTCTRVPQSFPSIDMFLSQTNCHIIFDKSKAAVLLFSLEGKVIKSMNYLLSLASLFVYIFFSKIHFSWSQN